MNATNKQSRHPCPRPPPPPPPPPLLIYLDYSTNPTEEPICDDWKPGASFSIRGEAIIVATRLHIAYSDLHRKEAETKTISFPLGFRVSNQRFRLARIGMPPKNHPTMVFSTRNKIDVWLVAYSILVNWCEIRVATLGSSAVVLQSMSVLKKTLSPSYRGTGA